MPTPLATRSSVLPGRSAARIPSGTPTSSTITNAISASWSVSPPAVMTASRTSAPVVTERPKSSCTAPFSQIQYCTRNG